jgi:ATP dependent DNA ligase domain
MPADAFRSFPKAQAAFVEPMDCLPMPKLREGSQWVWEIKLDGYRTVAVKSGGAVTLYSRKRKILNKRFPYIVEPLRGLPDGTVVDGEVGAVRRNLKRPSPVVFPARLLRNSAAVSTTPTFLGDCHCNPLVCWAAFLMDKGSCNGYESLLMLSPSLAGRLDSALKS